MKAKEWVVRLTAQVQNATDATTEQLGEVLWENYSVSCTALMKECLEIVTLRTKNAQKKDYRSYGFRLENNTETNALREAMVKWKAVVHGVTEKLGDTPPFPLVNGALFLPWLTHLDTVIEDEKTSWSEAQAVLAGLEEMAGKLLIAQEKYVIVRFVMAREKILGKKNKLIDTYKQHAVNLMLGGLHKPNGYEESRDWIHKHRHEVLDMLGL